MYFIDSIFFLFSYSISSFLQQPFACLECGKAFLWKSGLEKHMRKHTREKPFVCHCGQRYFDLCLVFFTYILVVNNFMLLGENSQ